MPKKIIRTTDGMNIGLFIDMPKPGEFLHIGESLFIVVNVDNKKIICFNYIIEVE